MPNYRSSKKKNIEAIANRLPAEVAARRFVYDERDGFLKLEEKVVASTGPKRVTNARSIKDGESMKIVC